YAAGRGRGLSAQPAACASKDTPSPAGLHRHWRPFCLVFSAHFFGADMGACAYTTPHRPLSIGRGQALDSGGMSCHYEAYTSGSGYTLSWSDIRPDHTRAQRSTRQGGGNDYAT